MQGGIINALHRTDYKSGVQILSRGFDLSKFGSATKKSGQGDNFKYYARGIFLSEDWGANPKELPPHPWDHRDRGVYIFGTVNWQKPLEVNMHQDGVFYQKWLSDKYGGKVKGQLTTAIIQDGYDGIYVKDASEITIFDPDNFTIDPKKSQESIAAYQEWQGAKGSGFKEWLYNLEAAPKLDFMKHVWRAS